MDFLKPTPTAYIIKRRTFEGKNDHALTSSYMPSYKYWMRIEFADQKASENCFTSKRAAQEYYDRCVREAGKPL